MKDVVIGLIPAPGMPADLVNEISEDLPGLLSTVIDETVNWRIDRKVNALASSSEYLNETFDKSSRMLHANDWDMAIAVSDLPSISDRKVVISDFNYDQRLSLLSLPSLGIYKVQSKLKNLLLHHIEVLYDQETDDRVGDIQSEFINKITEVTPEENADSMNRYILRSTPGGWMRLVSGMTRLNQPWTALSNFKTIVGLSFATGTYISIFHTPWELSLEYSLWRFLLFMFIAIFSMTGWIIYVHNLWETRSNKSQSIYRYLYNFTTISTLLSITVVNYIIVALLLMLSVVTFVPIELFDVWTNTELEVTWPDYFKLVWFVSSAGVFAGAFGSTVEDEDTIRNVTYSYRQLYRHHEMQQEDVDMESKGYEDDDYQGEEQTHEESEEGK